MQSIAPAPVPQSLSNQDMNAADNDLRAQLAAVININNSAQQQQQHSGHPQQHPHGYGNDVHNAHASSSASPHNQNIDPSIGGPGGPGSDMMSAGALAAVGDEDEDSLGDGRKGGKRELSQSKRAAQNRAAQRAFRQRKEGYIKKLEEQVRELHQLEENYKAIQGENYSLREYIIHLQSRLIESQGEYPQPPANINLIHPHSRNDGRMEQQQQQQHAAPRRDGAPVAPMVPMMGPAQARSLAVAGLQSSKHGAEERSYDPNKRYKETTEGEAVEEEIIRSHLHQSGADGLPTSM